MTAEGLIASKYHTGLSTTKVWLIATLPRKHKHRHGFLRVFCRQHFDFFARVFTI